MKRNLLLIVLGVLIFAVSCKKDEGKEDEQIHPIFGKWRLEKALFNGSDKPELTDCEKKTNITYLQGNKYKAEYYQEKDGNCEFGVGTEGTYTISGKTIMKTEKDTKVIEQFKIEEGKLIITGGLGVSSYEETYVKVTE